ncbi:MAG: N-acetyltransferase [Bifidobacteriaceae bacterium]|nr:N-acetyltransferase [Bifidobacteriaceae bacterium]
MNTVTSTRSVRCATMQDLPAVLDIYEHARQMMIQNGNPTQWGTQFPRKSATLDDIQQSRLLLLTDVVDNTERILAQFALCKGADPNYESIDGAWLDDDEYVTIHRLASSGLERGTAKNCIEWVLERYGNVRIDTHKNNKAVQHIVESLGFVRCGFITLRDRKDDNIRISYQRHEC